MLIKIPTANNLTKQINITLHPQSNKIFIESGYDKDLINFIKSLSGDKWHTDIGMWSIDNNEHNNFVLQTVQGFKIDRYYTNDIHWVIYENFFKHQKEAFLFAFAKQRCMLALEMGLGKTLVCIRLMEHIAIHKKLYKWWLVAPFGAQQEWKRQLKKWDAKLTPVAMTTYESLHHLLRDYKEEDLPDGVIFDESIKIKNPLSLRGHYASILCEKLRKKSDETYIIMLSGSPAPKDPSDWWHQIECLQPGWLREGSILKFKNRYAIIEKQEGEYGIYPKIVGWREDELKKLSKNLAPIVLVKKKKDCMDLPDKIFEKIYCEVKPEDLNVAEALLKLCSTGIEALERLREFSDGFQYQIVDNTRKTTWFGSPKIQIVKELLEFYAKENGGPGRLVIYAAFQATVNKLCETVKECKWSFGCIDGRGWAGYITPSDCQSESSNILELFDDDFIENMCIIANPRCVHGLSLTKTECLVYYSNDFSVDARIQSLERRDRPGMSKEKGTRIVDIINLPVDKLIVDKLDAKISLQNTTLEEIQNCLQKKVF